jgi:RNA polymerase sigma-70 factor, ECF subfamily
VDDEHDPEQDGDLARRAALGDRDAFGLLVDRHGPSLYRYAARVLGDPALADDCVQETFLAAWRAVAQFRGDSSVRTWLFTIVRHEAQRRGRRASVELLDLADVQDQIRDLRADPEQQNLDAALRAALDLALRALPARQRAAWLLREVEELHYDEIAEVLGTTTTAVRGLLERARTALATALEAWQ